MPQQSEILAALENVPLFADTARAQLEVLLPHLEVQYVAAGQRIFNEGDTGTDMYIVFDGEVRVHRGEMTVNTIRRWQVFGEMSMLSPQPRLASATTSVDTTLLRLAHNDFIACMGDNPDVLRGVIGVLCRRQRDRVNERERDFLYLQQVDRVTAAAIAVEAGIFEPESLDEVAMRTDELGHLARVFQRMTREVYAREQRLQTQLQQLRIEVDKVKQTRAASEITDTDYFQRLQSRAADLRRQASTRE